MKANLLFTLLALVIALTSINSVDGQSVNKDLFAPEIVILTPSTEITTREATFVLRGLVLSYKLPLTEVTFVINGTPVARRKPELDTGFRYPFQEPIKLVTGKNQITVIAKNSRSQATATCPTIILDNSLARKPRLVILSIGISDYANSSLNSPARAIAAEKFATLIAQQPDCRYEVLKPLVLVGKDATRSAVFQGFDWLNKTATSADDVRVVFISGLTGKDDVGRHYLLSSQHGFESDLELTDIRNDLLWNRLNAAPGRALLFLDQSLPMFAPQNPITQRSVALPSKISAIVSPTPSTPFGPKPSNEGAFATALLDSLSKGADSSLDGVVDMGELLHWMQKRYFEITKSKQMPTLWGELGQKPTAVFCVQ